MIIPSPLMIYRPPRRRRYAVSQEDYDRRTEMFNKMQKEMDQLCMFIIALILGVPSIFIFYRIFWS